MLDTQSSHLSKTKLKKLRKLGLITEDTNLEHFSLAPKKEPAQGLILKPVKPITINQNKIFKSFDRGADIMIHGYPGTGKTHVALGLGLYAVMKLNMFKQVVIIRSTVPTRDMGFLPGKAEEKVAVYETPYISTCAKLFGRSDAYRQLKNREIIQFESTSFLRGQTFEDSFVFFDECQNATFHELDTVMTRMGENTRLVLSGDFKQGDLIKREDRNGLMNFIEIIKSIPDFDFIEMEIDDIVRSGRVKNYIIAKTNKGML
jgi:phosphate starvation-inducible PhoH-like protein